MGEVLAGPVYDTACILRADLDLAEIPRAKFDFDAVGHYARPDIFRLEVNERATPGVVSSPAITTQSEDDAILNELEPVVSRERS